MDLLDLPWRRRALDKYGFDGVSIEVRMLSAAEFKALTDLPGGEEGEALARKFLVEKTRALEGVTRGDEKVTSIAELLDDDAAPPALINAITQELIKASTLTEEERGN